ncbi:ferredoxin [Streptomyces mexicanus]|uniref:ferredoxin n=1 Tax=Streptomyces mexicanus TaxID=178566 RepID=UPI0031F13AA5
MSGRPGADRDTSAAAPASGAGTETWRVRVDATACMGTGICAGVAPGRFQVRDGVSHPTDEFVPPTQQVVDAAESCPLEAIAVTHRDTGARIAPEE